MPQSIRLGHFLQIIRILHRFFKGIFSPPRVAAKGIRQNQRPDLILRSISAGENEFLLRFRHMLTSPIIVSLK